LKPSSLPLSGMRVCSARHDKNFPWSSNFGWYVNIDLVTFPSGDVCNLNNIILLKQVPSSSYDEIWLNSRVLLGRFHFFENIYLPIRASSLIALIPSTMKWMVPVDFRSLRISSRMNDSLINILYLDLIALLMVALLMITHRQVRADCARKWMKKKVKDKERKVKKKNFNE
jgi:hypothetical protein